ncbi:hypothetical protein NEPAR06_1101 [Nematocida parisii]|uniref:Uncharacterized protein n=1 Tax=Nematocida parisii (strain ERTm3) TaxID=935791 RepID=I3EII5_NEMP3|nr:uncharacterized protein NEPG_01755 [Nematocida parisii ERTm1]EIJ89032.1 hypothetical protein NEQG_00851 [Nematocida parisii ERTm3]EIJ93413.1 hypothetical protein NEPG_01755 [Nematocida parisii ERTm1]KAI5144430.1 hypothetical protein NEPAR07_1088 [Nematocida parisii]KAI5154416.1 hypothetical protein NEPAR06_1101 [Nematocida parisii]|eukprot:XP_013059583.1 hypothetical protein NEPG_01755 [Nematocida parisii ERTm1]
MRRAMEKEEKMNNPEEKVVQKMTLSKEHKKALSNFREQVRYKDYKGLIKTLKIIEEVIRYSEKYVIEEKYKGKYDLIQENILLLKNILISDIKYSITNDKGLDKSAVLLSTILSEKYVSDVQRSVVTWMSNNVQMKHTKEIQKLEKLSEVNEYLKLLLKIKDEVGIKTAHLPIWWNISKVILCDLSVILKNKLIRVIDRAEFSCTDYLDALKQCMEFESTYLVTSGRKRISSETNNELEGLKLSERSPVHLKLLDDISTELPICNEELESNSLSLAFIPYIHIYIENELKCLKNDKIILFVNNTVDNSTYDIYSVLTQSLSKLTYFKFPSVGYAFLTTVDKTLGNIIRKSSFSKAKENFISAVETIHYINQMTKEMLLKLQKTFNISSIDSPHTLNALNELSQRVFASYMVTMQERLGFLNKKSLKECRLENYTTPFLAELIVEIELISSCSFTPHDFLVKEWLDMLGESIFLVLCDVKFNISQAQQILYFMSAIEIPLKSTISLQLNLDIQYSIFDKAKLFLKLFLLDPSAPIEFIENFYKMSNGIFAFHQVLTKIPKKHHKNLITEFNKNSSLKNTT